jgi:hypothetical protein
VRVKHRNIKAIATHAEVLLSVLAQTGSKDPAAASRAFAAGAQALDLELTFTEGADPNFQNLNTALSELRALKPLLKPKLLKACAATVLEDAEVSSAEGALLQGVAAALDCPLPPSIFAHGNTTPP